MNFDRQDSEFQEIIKKMRRRKRMIIPLIYYLKQSDIQICKDIELQVEIVIF